MKEALKSTAVGMLVVLGAAVLLVCMCHWPSFGLCMFWALGAGCIVALAWLIGEGLRGRGGYEGEEK